MSEGPMAWKWDIWFGFWALVWLVIACAVVWRLRRGGGRKQ
jgi:hypothetical protein